MPLSEDFSWGMIRIVDRLRVTNEYLTFGGRLDAGTVDDAIVAAFTSPAPLLRRGGHSQGWDAGADLVGAFFARLMVAVDYVPGFEAAIAEATPTPAMPRSSATRRSASGGPPSGTDSELGRLIRHEAVRLRSDVPDDWAAGARLLAASARRLTGTATADGRAVGHRRNGPAGTCGSPGRSPASMQKEARHEGPARDRWLTRIRRWRSRPRPA